MSYLFNDRIILLATVILFLTYLLLYCSKVPTKRNIKTLNVSINKSLLKYKALSIVLSLSYAIITIFFLIFLFGISGNKINKPSIINCYIILVLSTSFFVIAIVLFIIRKSKFKNNNNSSYILDSMSDKLYLIIYPQIINNNKVD